ncbi:hypothetical protein Droror1_Dr00026540 [Drosera rotundifolia]
MMTKSSQECLRFTRVLWVVVLFLGRPTKVGEGRMQLECVGKVDLVYRVMRVGVRGLDFRLCYRRGVKLFLFGFARSEGRVTDWVILCVLLRVVVCGFEVVLELSTLELIALTLEEPSDDGVEELLL